MTFKEFKGWINSLPDEFSDFVVEVAEEGTIDDQYTYRLDKPIIGMSVNEEDGHVLIFINPDKDIDLKN